MKLAALQIFQLYKLLNTKYIYMYKKCKSFTNLQKLQKRKK